jgi:hypothetical protein
MRATTLLLTASMRPSILPPSVVLRTHSPTVAGARSERARPGTVSPLSLPPGRLPRSLPPLGPRTCAALHRRPLTTLALASRSASEPATESVPPLDDEFFLGLSAEAQACTVNGTLAAIAKQLLWAAQPNYLSRCDTTATPHATCNQRHRMHTLHAAAGVSRRPSSTPLPRPLIQRGAGNPFRVRKAATGKADPRLRF